MGLSLLAGPAHAGKVALLLERYLARLDDEPFLIVPNRSDVDRVERDLLARAGCMLGELESGLLDPGDVDGELATLYAAYRAELGRLELWDRDTERRRAVERL